MRLHPHEIQAIERQPRRFSRPERTFISSAPASTTTPATLQDALADWDPDASSVTGWEALDKALRDYRTD